MPRTVLVTGATGFIAKHIVLQLLNAGHSVVGSTRSLDREEELREAVAPHLDDRAALDRLSVVALDLTREEGWSEALHGADALFHTASPFPMVQPQDENELIRPAVDGTLRALRAARASGIGRVVLTSSVAAVSSSELPPGRDHYTEDDWTDPAHPTASPYIKSKTLAERAAWDFVATEAPELALTTVNPVLVLGPPLDGNFGTSVQLVERLLSGKDPMMPKFGFNVVDVRDIAAMHVAALDRPDTAGRRYIGSDRFMPFAEIAKVVKAAYPERRIATREAPNALMRLLAVFDPSIRQILPSLGRRDVVSGARAQADLGIAFRPAEATIRDTAHWLVTHAGA